MSEQYDRSSFTSHTGHQRNRQANAITLPGADSVALNRRQLLEGGAIGAIAATMSIAFNGGLLSPMEAKAQSVPLTVLSDAEGALLEAVGEIMLPGATAAGIANFVDTQLAKPTPLLIARYFDWPGSLTDFYTQGLAALNKASQSAFKTDFVKATTEQQTKLMGAFLSGKVDGWDGPPAPLFYLAVRGDAVDVVYGTVEGFDLLTIPYMPHILPRERW